MNEDDFCPNDPDSENLDSDGDGVGDICDVCPDDPEKTFSEGICGCGVAETDGDGDGVLDCIDNCPDVFNGSQLDSDGDGVGDACDAAPYDKNLK